jgi:hypothetical protein
LSSATYRRTTPTSAAARSSRCISPGWRSVWQLSARLPGPRAAWRLARVRLGGVQAALVALVVADIKMLPRFTT